MTEFIALTKYNWVLWVAGLFALLEFFKWLYSLKDFICGKIGIKTKGMLLREEYDNRLTAVENSIEEIKNTSKNNVEMFLEHERQAVDRFEIVGDEIVAEINKLNAKIDEQRADMEKAKELSAKTDRAMLRDRIASGMRFFSQNKDADGNVHISMGDYENMEDLFQEYFSKHGNGTFKKMYETEFQKFIIDR